MKNSAHSSVKVFGIEGSFQFLNASKKTVTTSKSLKTYGYQINYIGGP